MLYLIHFDTPLRHARHYLGFCRDGRDLEKRLEEHRSGHGARILAACNAAGIGYTVARTLEGGRRDERRFKQWHGLTKLCPLCNPPAGRPGHERKARPATASARPTTAATAKGATRADDELPY